MMLQLNPTIPVYSKGHGEGEAMIIIDYGPDVNTVWAVRLKGGEVKHFYLDDIRIYGNPMNGGGWDVNIPENWQPAGGRIPKDILDKILK